MKDMIMLIICLILIFSALGSYPAWPYSRNWGYYPAGTLGFVVLVLLVLLVIGKI